MLVGADGTRDAALAICDCGRVTPERSVLDADPLPYVREAPAV